MPWPSAQDTDRPDPAEEQIHQQRLLDPSRIRTRMLMRESPSSTRTRLRQRVIGDTPKDGELS